MLSKSIRNNTIILNLTMLIFFKCYEQNYKNLITSLYLPTLVSSILSIYRNRAILDALVLQSLENYPSYFPCSKVQYHLYKVNQILVRDISCRRAIFSLHSLVPLKIATPSSSMWKSVGAMFKSL